MARSAMGVGRGTRQGGSTTVEGPTRAKVTEPRFLHICANLYTHAYTHTHTHVRNASLLPTWIAILRVYVCARIALFTPLYPAIHRRVRCTRPKEKHGHSENRRAGQAKKKSYPEWREDGYSARKLEIDGGNERARTRDIVKCRAAEGIYRDLMSRIGRVVPARPVRQSWRGRKGGRKGGRKSGVFEFRVRSLAIEARTYIPRDRNRRHGG